MSRPVAVCVRCGGNRSDYGSICPHCGLRPLGDGLLVAWLLSSEHLDHEDLAAVGARIRAGELVRPTGRLLRKARVALGRHFSSDTGMTAGQRAALLATSLLLTPAVGWTIWFWWRDRRPRAAVQALGLSLPATMVFFSLVVWLRLFEPVVDLFP